MLREFVLDVDVVGRNAELLAKEVADHSRHAVAMLTIGNAEELDLHHGNRETVVATEPKATVIGKIQHQPIFTLAGEFSDRLSKPTLEDLLLLS